MKPFVVAQSGSAVLVKTGETEVASGRVVPRGRVFDRTSGELFPEMYLDSIVKFGYWVEFTGSATERHAIEHIVSARLNDLQEGSS